MLKNKFENNSSEPYLKSEIKKQNSQLQRFLGLLSRLDSLAWLFIPYLIFSYFYLAQWLLGRKWQWHFISDKRRRSHWENYKRSFPKSYDGNESESKKRLPSKHSFILSSLPAISNSMPCKLQLTNKWPLQKIKLLRKARIRNFEWGQLSKYQLSL